MLIQFLDKFKEWLELDELSENTRHQYIRYYEKFSEGYSIVSQENVDKFLLKKENRNIVARATVKRIKDFLIRYREALNLDKEYVNEISLIIIPKPKGRQKKRLIEPLSIDEIRSMENHIREEIIKIALWLGYYAGLRISEIVNLRINDFDWKKWKRTLSQIGERSQVEDYTDFLECKFVGKGNKERKVFIPPEFALRIAKYIKENSAMCYEYANSKLIHDQRKKWNRKNKCLEKSLIRYIERVFKEAGEKAGISVDEQGNTIYSKRTNPHKLRHSFGGNLAKNDVDLGIIKEALGHASIQSTQIYTHLRPSDVKRKLKEIRNKQKNINQ